MTAGIVLGIAGTMLTFNSIMGMMTNAGSYLGLGSYTLGGFPGIGSGVVFFVALLGALPNILIAMALWFLFATAKTVGHEPLRATGFTILYVIAIIQMVFPCLGYGLAELALILFACSMSGDIVGIILGVALLVAAIGALHIFYCWKVVQSISVVRAGLATGRPSGRVSAFVGVMCCIIGGVSALGAIFSGSIVSIIASLASATATILFGVLLFKYQAEADSSAM